MAQLNISTKLMMSKQHWQRGVPRTEVLKVLNENGFNMTLSAFAAALRRIRKKRRATKPASATRGKQENDEENKLESSYPNSDPRELDKIFGDATHDLEALAKHEKKLEAKPKEKK